MTIGWAEVAGERLEYLRIAPERTSPTLVFLHEGLGSVAGWRDFPRAVCDRLEAPGLVYSRRGYGRSTPLDGPRGTDYLHREAWVVLQALLVELGIEAPLLVGHSDGGSIALLYAARHSPRAIAIMAPHVFVEDVTIDGIRAAREAWRQGKLRAPLAKVHEDPDGAFFGWNDGWLEPAGRGQRLGIGDLHQQVFRPQRIIAQLGLAPGLIGGIVVRVKRAVRLDHLQPPCLG